MSDAAQPVAADADAGQGDLNDEATAEVEAEFVVIRVLSVPRDFTDRGADESWTWEGERGPAAGGQYDRHRRWPYARVPRRTPGASRVAAVRP